jgi:DNA polymerase
MTDRAHADPRGAASYVPPSSSLTELATAARACHGCPLWEPATQTVFGAGSAASTMMLVGEQPGDREDLEGSPFVGPAGRVLWSCLEEAGIARDDVYVTNAVKHFKFEARGKRRLHKKPNTAEVEACHPWLEAELAAVEPAVVVLLGATAARSALGRTTSIAAGRSETFSVHGVPAFVTYHPSAVLRADENATEIRRALTADLRHAREQLAR